MTPAVRIHGSLGALNELTFQLAISASKAAGDDQYHVARDRALSAIGRMREALRTLEGDLLPTGRDIDAWAKAAPDQQTIEFELQSQVHQ